MLAGKIYIPLKLLQVKRNGKKKKGELAIVVRVKQSKKSLNYH